MVSGRLVEKRAPNIVVARLGNAIMYDRVIPRNKAGTSIITIPYNNLLLKSFKKLASVIQTSGDHSMVRGEQF
jgi:hypothetical protein